MPFQSFAPFLIMTFNVISLHNGEIDPIMIFSSICTHFYPIRISYKCNLSSKLKMG